MQTSAGVGLGSRRSKESRLPGWAGRWAAGQAARRDHIAAGGEQANLAEVGPGHPPARLARVPLPKRAMFQEENKKFT